MNKENIESIIQKLESALYELKIEMLSTNEKASEVQDYISKADFILARSTNQAQINFITGIKSFAETHGYLSKGQSTSLELTYKAVKSLMP